MRSTSRSKCSRIRGSVRPPYGDSSRRLTARLNSCLARLDVAQLELPLPGGEMALRFGDQGQNRILGRRRRRSERRRRSGWRGCRRAGSDVTPASTLTAWVRESRRPACRRRSGDAGRSARQRRVFCPYIREAARQDTSLTAEPSTISLARSIVGSVLRLRANGATVNTRCCIAQLSRRRRHDGPFGDDKLSTRLQRQPYIFLTDEIERRLVGLGSGRRACGAAGRRGCRRPEQPPPATARTVRRAIPGHGARLAEARASALIPAAAGCAEPRRADGRRGRQIS